MSLFLILFLQVSSILNFIKYHKLVYSYINYQLRYLLFGISSSCIRYFLLKSYNAWKPLIHIILIKKCKKIKIKIHKKKKKKLFFVGKNIIYNWHSLCNRKNECLNANGCLVILLTCTQLNCYFLNNNINNIYNALKTVPLCW